ncbi:MAG: hypothetical protein ACRBDI_01740 [Alphaproteobacteria bacterium]
MEMRKAQNMFSWVVIASEVSHVFCCVLPSIFSVLTILVGMGLIGAMPIWMDGFHAIMHNYEIPLITMSGIIVLLGWGMHFIAKRIDCRNNGCGHGSCKPKNKKALAILKFATFLFVANIMIYITLHKDVGALNMNNDTVVPAPISDHHDH